MTQVAPQTKSWTKPEFKRLGQINDVAANASTIHVQNSTKS